MRFVYNQNKPLLHSTTCAVYFSKLLKPRFLMQYILLTFFSKLLKLIFSCNTFTTVNRNYCCCVYLFIYLFIIVFSFYFFFLSCGGAGWCSMHLIVHVYVCIHVYTTEQTTIYCYPHSKFLLTSQRCGCIITTVEFTTQSPAN